MLYNVYAGSTVILPKRNLGALSVIITDEGHSVLFSSGFRITTDTGERLTDTVLQMYQILVATIYSWKFINTLQQEEPGYFIIHTLSGECSSVMSGLSASWNLEIVKLKWAVQEVAYLLRDKGHYTKFHFSDPGIMHSKALSLAQRALIKGVSDETRNDSSRGELLELPELQKAKVVG